MDPPPEQLPQRRYRLRRYCKRAFIAGLALAMIVVVIILLIYVLTPHRCFLDILNAQISKQCDFQPFYAGRGDLPATREVIPELGELEDAFPTIRAEMEAALGDRSRVPYMHETYDNIFLYKGSGATSSAGPLRALQKGVTKAASQLIYGRDTDIFDRIGSKDWKTYNLVLFDHDVPGNADKCPTTVSLLRRVPGVQSALFSVIAPGAYIPPHNDPAKGVIRYHLALSVPKNRAGCFIEVDGQRYHWTEGQGVLFDDVYDHSVQNNTDEERVILFVDILRPLSGWAKRLQGLANLANRNNPGVRRLIRESVVA